jgi:uncharacterized protein (TIGR03086 family)
MHDLTPASRRLAELVAAVPDDALGAPTPCTEYSLGDLLDHVGGLAIAFTAAARKQPLDGGGASGDASRLGDDWRTRIPRDVLALAEAWKDPEAWTGMTAAGGVEMPGEIGGLVALDELVAHGWDVARALGEPYEMDDATLQAVLGIVSQFGDDRGDAFAPERPVPHDAPLLDRVVALTGRDPGWAPQ